MSGQATGHLSKERIHQLLAAVGSKPGEDADPKESAEYNWYEPQYFSSQQLVKLNDFINQLATAVSDTFYSFCRCKFDVTIASTTFHFASEFLNQSSKSESKDYYFPFGIDQEHICGFIGIPEQAAIVWARQLLGDCGSEKESDVTLSQLEESLLFDLTSALTGVFSSLHAGADFCPTGRFLKNQWPLNVYDTEELCRISFDVKKADSEDKSGAYLLIVCEALNTVVGKAIHTSDTFSKEEISEAILNHLQAVPVTITARLVSTELTFGEIATLQVDDILLLNKPVDQPVDLIVDSQTVYYGWPAKSDGKYAVTITSAAFEEVP